MMMCEARAIQKAHNIHMPQQRPENVMAKATFVKAANLKRANSTQNQHGAVINQN